MVFLVAGWITDYRRKKRKVEASHERNDIGRQFWVHCEYSASRDSNDLTRCEMREKEESRMTPSILTQTAVGMKLLLQKE